MNKQLKVRVTGWAPATENIVHVPGTLTNLPQRLIKNALSDWNQPCTLNKIPVLGPIPTNVSEDLS